VLDGTERGVTTAGPDTDVARGNFVADADPSTTTSMVSSDTDRGSVPDGVEDTNHNGRVDAGERDPRDRRDDSPTPTATPSWTAPRARAIRTATVCPTRLDLDSDGDGISDATEAGDADLSTPPVDTDRDGTPDYPGHRQRRRRCARRDRGGRHRAGHATGGHRR
jgi:hypothetical protein